MVCDHCGSEAHRTGSSGCSKYCALCKAPGHRQKSGSCPFRECSKCKAVGHSARECKPLTIMVCAHCGSETHRTNHPNCTKYCTMCKSPGHGQKSGSCAFRECSKCKEVGHSAQECHLKNVRPYHRRTGAVFIDTQHPESTPKKRQRDPTIVNVDSL
jgi:hypothetical protein